MMQEPTADHNESNHMDTLSQENQDHDVISFNPDQLLAYGAKQIMSLFIPVTVCTFFVAIITRVVDFYSKPTTLYMPYTPFHTPNADVGTQIWQTVANTAIFMSVVVVMTCVLVALFKFHCYKIIHGWIILTTFIVVFFLSISFFFYVIQSMHISVDYITFSLLVWNFGVVGMIVIHWRGPLLLNQAYLIFMSAQIALLFVKYMPKWTSWLLLVALAVWDLIAVLCPHGPLRMLIEMAQEREHPLFPGLLYSTTSTFVLTVPANVGGCSERTHVTKKADQLSSSPVVYHRTATIKFIHHSSLNNTVSSDETVNEEAPLVGNTDSEQLSPANMGDYSTESIPATQSSTCDLQQPSDVLPSDSNAPREQPCREQENRLHGLHADLVSREERGVKLGLGDFVFYSLLMGRAALDGDAVTIVTCYVAILVGMSVTTILLGITRHALPALPISIAFGVLFYFVTSSVISPFIEALTLGPYFF